MITRMMDILTEMSENYSEAALGRALINLFPGGSSIDLLLTSRWDSYKKKRLEELVGYFKKELKRLDASKVDKTFLESEEFYDIIQRVIYDSLVSRIQEKRIAYAKSTIDFLENPTNIFDLEETISCISNIRERDFLYCKTIAILIKTKDNFRSVDFKDMLINMTYSEEEIRKHLYRLANLEIIDYPRNTLTIDPVFNITTLGRKLLNYMDL